MKRTLSAALAIGLLGLSSTAFAQEQLDPVGTWTWTVDFGGNSMERVLTLAMSDDVLTGTINGPNDSVTEISDAKYEEGKVTFRVVRNFNGQDFAIGYAGTVQGDTLSGETQASFNGEDRTWEWVAVRKTE